MEKLSLKRETDDFSIERLKKINNELISLKDKQAELGAQWKKEKHNAILELHMLPERLTNVISAVEHKRREQTRTGQTLNMSVT